EVSPSTRYPPVTTAATTPAGRRAMNGVHDLGGMHGFGPVEREENEPLFHAPWEAHVRALMTLSYGRGYFTIDAMRHGIERMAPAEYLRASYFERWLAS